jgi:hydrogenase/urease accessory protein HupE
VKLALLPLLLLIASRTHAHPLAPALLELVESAPGKVELRLRAPLARPGGAAFLPVPPQGCGVAGPVESRLDPVAETLLIPLDCGATPLAGQELGLDGLAESGSNALVRVELSDGRRISGVIDAGSPRLAIPERPSRAETVSSYLDLGVVHILTGLDHLLFVAGLVLLVSGARALLATVTAFTLGHALTLSLAALGLVRVPSAPVEVLIAASVFWLALELASDRARPRRPARLAACFGLLHGFGFAAALAETGLPAGEIPLALASFNAGIELSQLAVVGALLLVARVLREHTRALSYAFGSAAGFWLIERSLAWLGLA